MTTEPGRDRSGSGDELEPERLALRAKLTMARPWASEENQRARRRARERATRDPYEERVDPSGEMPARARAKAARNAELARYAWMTYRSSRVRGAD